MDLSTPIEADINVSSTTADITTNVTSYVPSTNGEVNDYFLEIVDNEEKEILGSTSVLSETGRQTISLINLDTNHEYKDYKIKAVDSLDTPTPKVFASSDLFTFKTTQEQITSISTPGESDIVVSTTTADITTITSTGTNGDIADYYLEVVDDRGNRLGETSLISDSGEQTISLEGLTMGKEYSDCKINAVDDLDNPTITFASSDTFSFETSRENVTELSDPTVESVTTTEATIKVNVISGSNGSLVSDYYLEVVDSSNNSLGQTELLKENGSEKIRLSNLESGKKYNDCKINAVDDLDNPTITFATSDPFSFETLKKSVSALSNAKSLSATWNSSVISIDIDASEYFDNVNSLNTYSLEVINSNNNVIGTSDANDWDVEGTQTFNLTGLDSGTSYNNLKVRVVNTSIVSNEFSFETSIKTATSLSNPEVISSTYKGAEIKVDVGTEEDSIGETIEEYSLLITDDKKGLSWTTDPLTTSGEQEISIDNLNEETEYNLIIQIEGTEIKTSPLTFTTKKLPIEIDIDSFSFKSATRNSFTFSINITSSEEGFKFDGKGLHLFSGEDKLRTVFVSSISNDNGEYILIKQKVYIQIIFIQIFE